jgi:serine/threonine-protein kinase
MILPNLSAFLQGKYQPQENDERLALLGVCQFESLNVAAAHLYVDAFAADPALADESTADCLRRAAHEASSVDRIEALNTERRYLAARCAALAGSGLGKDGNLGETERARWRKQAREWLQADLLAWAKALDSGSKASGDRAREMLTLWQAEKDLAGIRDASALDNLESLEREECAALWKQVAAVLNRAQATK